MLEPYPTVVTSCRHAVPTLRCAFPWRSQPLGMAAAKAFTDTILFERTELMVAERRWMDPKTKLQFCLNEFNSHYEHSVSACVRACVARVGV